MNNYPLIHLRDILAPWPARSGLYVISGTVEMIPVLEDILVQFFDAGMKVKEAPLIGPVLWIDSGNSFNAYQMAELAKRRGIDSRMVLKTLRIARPFTAFQFQQMLEKVPSPALIKVEGERQPVPRLPLVVISDLMGLFYDPEIQESDLKRAYREFLEKMLKLKRRAIVLSLLINRPVPENRSFLLPRILQMADHIHGRVSAILPQNRAEVAP